MAKTASNTSKQATYTPSKEAQQVAQKHGARFVPDGQTPAGGPAGTVSNPPDPGSGK